MQTCFHCEIPIDPRFDEPHELKTGEICCDSCYNDYVSFGQDFGDSFYGRHNGCKCPHIEWAKEEVAIREAIA